MSRRFTNLDHFRSFVFPVSAAGTAEQLAVKISGTTLAFNAKGSAVKDTAGGTVLYDNITDSAKNFFTQGFKTGDQITVTGAGANNGNYVIYDISADGGTIILTSSGVLTTAVAGPAIVITSLITVPEGIAITIKAKKTNTQKIYVGQGKLSAQGHNCFTLSANESMFLQIRKTDTLWLDADVSAESVEVNCEQNKQGVE